MTEIDICIDEWQSIHRHRDTDITAVTD